MTPEPAPAAGGFHDGERAVQQTAGVRAAAARLEGMLGPADLGAGTRRFLEERTLIVVTARGRDGRLWVSPLVGPAGFVEVSGRTGVRIHAAPADEGDPLRDLPADQPIGTIALDLARRRRFRLNGHLTGVSAAGLEIEVGEAFGNCPQYIVPRSVVPTAGTATLGPPLPHGVAADLDEHDRDLIAHADTFVLGTTHPDRGHDASHRGGPPGFVRLTGHTLEWPDYPGNNMFTSLGNLAVDPSAALAFLDFDHGRTLHLSGHARLRRTAPGASGDPAGTGRRVAFDATAVARSGLSARASGPTGPAPHLS